MRSRGQRNVPTSNASTEGTQEFHACAERFVNLTERELSSGDLSRVASGDLERVITAAVKLYVAKTEVEGKFPAPVSTEITTPTEIVVVVSEMLRAVNLNLFDLAMWYRRPR